jgi:DNA helicase-2/ATP-dependent DNA helicase PcrA
MAIKYTESQKIAIETLDKNLQIIACAGSGKTQVISERVVNLIRNGAKPSEIIAFTYTEKAASELKVRILELCKEQLGKVEGLSEMYIGTIHSWCLDFLQDNIFEYQKFSVLDEIKLKLFVDKHYEEIGMMHAGMERFKETGYFTQMMGLLREFELNKEFVTERQKESLVMFENKLKEHCYFDFTMIMTDLLDHLKNNPELRNKIKSKIKYLIVDEYQDINNVQEEIIENIYNLDTNICVVGDDDQNIYQWRGGDIKHIQGFKHKYKDVVYITLEDNFRSSPAIVEVALKVITNNENRLVKSMNAKSHQEYEKGDILYNEYTNTDDEYKGIVKQINSLRGVVFYDKDKNVERGLDYSDFTILVRKWKKADRIVDILKENNIPFVVTGVNSLFDTKEVKLAKLIFSYLAEEIDQETFKTSWLDLSTLIKPENLDEAIEFLNINKPKKTGFYDQFNLQLTYLGFLKRIEINEEQFKNTYENLADYDSGEIVFYNLGMFSQIINDFESIYYKSGPKSKLNSFLNFLRYVAEGYYPEGWLNNNYKVPNAVQITSIFQSKGLEYPVVFIPGLNKNYLPTSKRGGKGIWHFLAKEAIVGQEKFESSVEDERRLMYVAITRSKKFLFISRAPENTLYKHESTFGKEVKRSEYVFESKDRDFKERNRTEPKAKNNISNVTLNFSLLKDYFDDPYFFKIKTFYGFCSNIGKFMGYGKSLHDCLMELHRTYLDDKIVNKGELPALLNKHFYLPHCDEDNKEKMRNSGIKAINKYFDSNAETFKDIEYAEKEIQIDLGGGILVNGKIDLIKKRLENGTYEKTIIDFKSTKDSQTEYATIDQLQLYALGYEEITGEKPDFLEIFPLDDENERKKIEMKKEDMGKIKEKIKDAAENIRSNNLPFTPGKSENWINELTF